ncbi:pyridoxine 5'-phosphate synthase [Azorhizobium sp. AG788]|uniref:pyridoxine 5'-phosphate synthase n=1 Tax=Azorhizobium sp. AG788 TaxID=2183897 RepID=UPI00105C8A2E|nr:pyridoxine 5'-phosphate synthase [Azorhizobium sp. AG788]TDT99203.1 pyridoxine 5'-phosphate synthase [Azorhizobium sp. AG788]
MTAPIRLGLNVDHVATVRNARGGLNPDPVRAALLAAEAGVDGITAHLREDRRHIRDADIARIRSEVALPLNFEMAATDEMIAIALSVKPHACCLVPERREERTTEGGLDVAGQAADLRPRIAALNAAGIRVSLFIAADPVQIAAARALQASVIELHTGAWCEALAAGHLAEASAEFERLRTGAREAAALGLEVHAGHGLDYETAEQIAALPEIAELNIGHFMIGEAIFEGLPGVVSLMREAMARGQDRRELAA